jgi:hypothetical protein
LLARCQRGDRSVWGECSFNRRECARAGVRNLSQFSSRTRRSDIMLTVRDRAGSVQPEPTSSLREMVVSLRAGTSPPRSAPPRSPSAPRRARAAMRSHLGHVGPNLLAHCPRGDFSAWGEQLYWGECDCAGSAQPEPPLSAEIVLSFRAGTSPQRSAPQRLRSHPPWYRRRQAPLGPAAVRARGAHPPRWRVRRICLRRSCVQRLRPALTVLAAPSARPCQQLSAP